MSGLIDGADGDVQIVVFTGGRGARVLSRHLVAHPHVRLTLAINGYDDGKSTGAVRRWLGDALGPSDFRKNAAWMATQLRSCEAGWGNVLESRLGVPCSASEAIETLRAVVRAARLAEPGDSETTRAVAGFSQATRLRIEQVVERVLAGPPDPAALEFADCALGNILFAGCYLEAGRDFNRALDRFVTLIGLPPGSLENVSDGRNAYLVALDRDGRLLASEAEIVDQARPSVIDELFLIDQLTQDDVIRTWNDPERLRAELRARSVEVKANRRLLTRLANAEIVIYAPGTQHSSLLPSYLTEGVGATIAGNLKALKVLITNIHGDAESAESSAVDIIERAVFYLRRKNLDRTPIPCLVTHYLINEPGASDEAVPYVPLGQIERLEDPRLVRVADYEDGASGRHDAAKVVAPIVEGLLRRQERPTIGVLLFDTTSEDKVVQTVLEALRGGLDRLPFRVAFYYATPAPLAPAVAGRFPFELVFVSGGAEAPGRAMATRAASDRLDYVIGFESSGAYRGEDIATVASLLVHSRVDAVWGSRRLSIRDIRQSYRFRYRRNVALGAVSYIGSYVLSLAYLALYGRYLSDTLTGVRGIRASLIRAAGLDLAHPSFNQHAISTVLRAQGEILETPVQFMPLSPNLVRRTSVADGLHALGAILWWRVRPGGRTVRAVVERRDARVEQATWHV